MTTHVDITETPLCPDKVLDDMDVATTFVILRDGRILDGAPDCHVAMLADDHAKREFPHLLDAEGRVSLEAVSEWRDDHASGDGHSGHVVGDAAYLWGKPSDAEVEALVVRYGVTRIRFWKDRSRRPR